ncbi:hypothetical protein SAMN05421538_1255 [Paracoccus isoporae]|uniref:Uncharacterized protein n=1 Tax=Paracoccus isoporae TaxID=591205 RepID=A0A1G7HN32_9RHOB|nr:hypothetical protein SAMN05421538_1255 [Paracoccus isoporae]
MHYVANAYCVPAVLPLRHTVAKDSGDPFLWFLPRGK